jgi:hypothetical protein
VNCAGTPLSANCSSLAVFEVPANAFEDAPRRFLGTFRGSLGRGAGTRELSEIVGGALHLAAIDRQDQ